MTMVRKSPNLGGLPTAAQSSSCGVAISKLIVKTPTPPAFLKASSKPSGSFLPAALHAKSPKAMNPRFHPPATVSSSCVKTKSGPSVSMKTPNHRSSSTQKVRPANSAGRPMAPNWLSSRHVVITPSSPCIASPRNPSAISILASIAIPNPSGLPTVSRLLLSVFLHPRSLSVLDAALRSLVYSHRRR
jgi:hypothetical protein